MRLPTTSALRLASPALVLALLGPASIVVGFSACWALQSSPAVWYLAAATTGWPPGFALAVVGCAVVVAVNGAAVGLIAASWAAAWRRPSRRGRYS